MAGYLLDDDLNVVTDQQHLTDFSRKYKHYKFLCLDMRYAFDAGKRLAHVAFRFVSRVAVKLIGDRAFVGSEFLPADRRLVSGWNSAASDVVKMLGLKVDSCVHFHSLVRRCCSRHAPIVQKPYRLSRDIGKRII